MLYPIIKNNMFMTVTMSQCKCQDSYTGELIPGSRPFAQNGAQLQAIVKSLLLMIKHSNNQENVKQGVLSLHPWS